MEILRIVSIAVIASIMCLFVSDDNKVFRIYISVAAGILILTMSSDYLLAAFNFISNVSNYSSIAPQYLEIIFKIIAIAYIAQFASDICADAGERSIAAKIEIASRFVIVYLSLPILINFFELVVSIL